MSRPVPTPMLDLAAIRELTSSQMVAALLELGNLDPNQRDYGIRIFPYSAGFIACRIVTDMGSSRDMHPTVEAALRAERAALLEIAEEIEAGL